MKKGFTLVELLTVVSLIGIFLIITIPTIDNTLERQKDNIITSQKEEIKDALKLYLNKHLDLYPENVGDTSGEITLKALKDEGLIKKDFKNPKTGKCYDELNNKFEVIHTSNGLDYSIVTDLKDSSSKEC